MASGRDCGHVTTRAEQRKVTNVIDCFRAITPMKWMKSSNNEVAARIFLENLRHNLLQTKLIDKSKHKV